LHAVAAWGKRLKKAFKASGVPFLSANWQASSASLRLAALADVILSWKAVTATTAIAEIPTIFRVFLMINSH